MDWAKKTLGMNYKWGAVDVDWGIPTFRELKPFMAHQGKAICIMDIPGFNNYSPRIIGNASLENMS